MNQASRASATNAPWVPLLAWGSLGVTIALSAVAAAFQVAAWHAPWPPTIFATKGYATALAIAFGASGAFIAARRPENPIGWICCGAALLSAVQGLGEAYALLALQPGEGEPALGLWGAWLTEWIWIPAVAGVGLIAALFPDGAWASRRWRTVMLIGLAGTAVTMVFAAFTPVLTIFPGHDNPVGVTGIELTDYTKWSTLPFLFFIVVLVGGVASAIGRFRRSTGDERQQLKWLILATAFVAITLGFYIVYVGATGWNPSIDITWAENVAALSFLGVPVAIAIGILKYRLYDIDVVIKKTVVFAIVAGGITLVAVGVVLGLPTLAIGTGLTGWERGLLLVGVAIGLLVGPLRRLARRIADRVVYGGRATPYETLTEFSERMSVAYGSDDVLSRLAAVLGEGVGARRAVVWLRLSTGLRPEAVWPVDADRPGAPPDDAVDIVHHGDRLGALSVDMPANDPMDATKERLIRDLAGHAGLVLRNVRLIEELRASRQRLVAAQDEERRKLERNIHDGAQQQLVALAVQLRLADGLVERDPARTHEVLAKLQEDTTEALEDLRDLARGIYPPLLADKGLAAALEAQARKAAVPTSVEVDGLGRYPQDVESTVYFCCLEGLNNVAKYADASSATVELAQSNGSLVFMVKDDGRGFEVAAVTGGTGLQSMYDRLDAIGGSLRIESAPGDGTTVRGSIPIAGSSG